MQYDGSLPILIMSLFLYSSNKPFSVDAEITILVQILPGFVNDGAIIEKQMQPFDLARRYVHVMAFDIGLLIYGVRQYREIMFRHNGCSSSSLTIETF